MAKLNSLEDLKNLFPEAIDTYQPDSKDSFVPQDLEAHFSNKGRAGKTLTLIKGFSGTEEELQALGKALKKHCGVGGTIKDGEILIQGNYRDKIMTYLQELGHRVKRVGG